MSDADRIQKQLLFGELMHNRGKDCRPSTYELKRKKEEEEETLFDNITPALWSYNFNRPTDIGL